MTGTAPSGTPADRRVFVEIRAARGVADQAAAADFAGEVLRELSRVGEERGWQLQIHALQETDGPGLQRAELVILGAMPVTGRPKDRATSE